MTTLLYFAWVRERVGMGEEQVALPPEVSTARDLAAWLVLRSDAHASAFVDLSRLRVAIDQQMGGFDDDVRSASEVAFFPPVTGG